MIFSCMAGNILWLKEPQCMQNAKTILCIVNKPVAGEWSSSNIIVIKVVRVMHC